MKYVFISVFIIFAFSGCIDESEEFGDADLYSYISGTAKVMSYDSSKIFYERYLGQEGYFGFFQSVNDMMNCSSFEFIREDTEESIIYYHPDINYDNYQEYFDRTPFKVENWEEIGKYSHHYYIYENDFD